MENIEIKEKPDNKEYEISFLTKEEGGGAEIMKLLKQHAFEVEFENPAKKIALAYKIKKELNAYFGFIHAKGDPSEIKNLTHDLESNPQILRFLIITPPFSKAKTVSQKPRPTRISKPKAETEEKTNLPISNEALEKKIEEILQ